MAYPSPSQAQLPFDPSTPPPPPPKPAAHSSGHGTPLSGPPLPPQPPNQAFSGYQTQQPPSQVVSPVPAAVSAAPPAIPLPEEGWLPQILTDKTTLDLQDVLRNPDLQRSLIHSPTTTHSSLASSTGPVLDLLAANLSLADSVKSLEARLAHQRSLTQSRLLSLRALERQWRAKQAEQDDALRNFSPPALYQRLSASVGEQETLCRGLEESFLEDDGEATEREVAEFVRRLREGRKVAYLRGESKERWDEGRVGGWR